MFGGGWLVSGLLPPFFNQSGSGMESFVQLADRYGVSLCLLCVCIVFAVRVVRWFAPRVDRVVDTHVRFVDTVGIQVSEQTACMRALADGQSRHGSKLDEIHEKLTRG